MTVKMKSLYKLPNGLLVVYTTAWQILHFVAQDGLELTT